MFREDYRCPDCDLVWPVYRTNRRKKNHKKKLWCVWCGEEKNFVFRSEFSNKERIDE